MKKYILMFMVISTVLLSGCDGVCMVVGLEIPENFTESQRITYCKQSCIEKCNWTGGEFSMFYDGNECFCDKNFESLIGIVEV